MELIEYCKVHQVYDKYNLYLNILETHDFKYVNKKTKFTCFVCSNCKYILYAAIGGLAIRNGANGKIVYINDKILTCNELIIKSIIE